MSFSSFIPYTSRAMSKPGVFLLISFSSSSDREGKKIILRSEERRVGKECA